MFPAKGHPRAGPFRSVPDRLGLRRFFGGTAMGFRIAGPQVVSFLEFASQQHPDAQGFFDLSYDQRDGLIRRFEALMPSELLMDDYDIKHLVKHGFLRLTEEGYSVVDRQNWLGRMFRREAADDALAKYRAATAKGIFLYTDQDREFVEYLTHFWRAIDAESGSLLHFFDYGLDRGIRTSDRRYRRQPYTYAENYIRSLSPIPGAELPRIRAVGLPSFLVWTEAGDSAVVPFADVQDNPAGIRDRIREILDHIDRAQIDALRYRFEGLARDAKAQKTDVFISYNHADRAWVQNLHHAFKAVGLDAWYDEHLQAGERWDIRLNHMLNKAKAIVVVWSNRSVKSDFVQAEAHYGRSKRKVVPLFKETPLELPVPFNTIQTIDMSHWSKGELLPSALLEPLRLALGSSIRS